MADPIGFVLAEVFHTSRQVRKILGQYPTLDDAEDEMTGLAVKGRSVRDLAVLALFNLDDLPHQDEAGGD